MEDLTLTQIFDLCVRRRRLNQATDEIYQFISTLHTHRGSDPCPSSPHNLKTSSFNGKLMAHSGHPKQGRETRTNTRSSMLFLVEKSPVRRVCFLLQGNHMDQGQLFEDLIFQLKIAGYLFRRRTNVQQLTCKIDLSSSFYYLFLFFVLLELKPFVLKGKVPGENYEKVPKSVKMWKIMKRFCPLVVAL